MALQSSHANVEGAKKMKVPKVYLAGPITGMPQRNEKSFRLATADLRARGYTVFSPIEADYESGLGENAEWSQYMKRDMKELIKCTHLYALPGWEYSKGARLEVHVAKTLGLEVIEYETGKEIQTSVTHEAESLVFGNRQANYGHPKQNFARAGKMWTGTILHKLKPGEEITAKDVSLMMAQMKIAREINEHKRDNVTDLIGYALTAGIIESV